MSSFVTRKTPEQLQARTRRNAYRAAVGLAACIGGLFGLTTLATAEAAHTVKNVQQAAEDYLTPAHKRDDGPFRHVSHNESEHEWPPVAVHIPAAEPKAHDTAVDWKTPLVAISGASALGLGGFVVLGAAARRREDPNAPEATDFETEPTYTDYSYELTAAAQRAREQTLAEQVDGAFTGLEEHTADVEYHANTALITARLKNPLNLAHMAALGSIGQTTVHALNYSTPETFYGHLDAGSTIAEACQPVVTALQ